MKAAIGLSLLSVLLLFDISRREPSREHSTGTPPHDDYRRMLAACATVSLLVAPLGPLWNRTMDLALYQSGKVPYPSENPMRDYFSTFNLPARLLAALFRFGASDVVIALTSSVALLFIGTFALTLIIYSPSSRPFWSAAVGSLAVLAPRQINPSFLFLDASAHVYPALTWTTHHTMGLYGLYLLLLVIGLEINDFRRRAVGAVVLTAAAHPVFGAFAAAFLFLNVVLSKPFVQRLSKRKTSVALLAVALIGILITSGRRSFRSDEERSLVRTFEDLWDGHRGGAEVIRVNVVASILFATSICWLMSFLTPPASLKRRRTFRILALINGLAGVLYLAQIVNWLSDPLSFVRTYQLGRLTLLSGYLNLAFLAAYILRITHRNVKWSIPRSRTVSKISIAAVLTAITAIYAPTLMSAPTYDCPTISPNIFFGTSESSLSLYRECRWPVALDTTGLDFVPYFPDTAPAVNELLSIGYGIGLGDLSPEFQNRGSLPDEAFRAIWEGRTRSEWMEVYESTRIRYLAAPEQWKLSAEPVAAFKNYVVRDLKDSME